MRVKRVTALAATLGIAAMLVAAPRDVHAELIFFTDRTAFDAATGGGLNFESFEGVSGNNFPGVDLGDFTLEERDGSANNVFASGLGVTHGTRSAAFVAQFAGSFGSDGLFEFDSPINAFGVDLAINDAGQTITEADLTIYFTSVTQFGNFILHLPLGNTTVNRTANVSAFFGAISTAGTFDRVVVDPEDINGLGVGFDALSYGQAELNANAVPEPSSLVLLGSGALAFLGCRGRRRQRDRTRVSQAESEPPCGP